MIDVYESAKRLVKAATGEEYGDYDLVDNLGVGTQWDDEKVWVSGTWRGDLGNRLFKALERIGVECANSDEVDRCYDCGKMIETRATHYGWQSRYLTDDECQRVCFDCLDVSNDEVLDEFGYIDNPEKAIPDVLARHLPEWGWAPYNGTYENGWHPGQDDKPSEIFDKIKEEKPEVSVVFRLDEVSQFYIRFTAWTKNRGEDNE